MSSLLYLGRLVYDHLRCQNRQPAGTCEQSSCYGSGWNFRSSCREQICCCLMVQALGRTEPSGRVGNGASTLLLFKSLRLHCTFSCKAVSFVPRGGKYLQANWVRERKHLFVFSLYKELFLFALLHGIYSLNLSIVVCIVTETAVLIYYMHYSPASSSVSEYHFNWKCFLTILLLYLLCRSEANDLALRLARQYHGHQDVITLEK